jgi:hypothetical protein
MAEKLWGWVGITAKRSVSPAGVLYPAVGIPLALYGFHPSYAVEGKHWAPSKPVMPVLIMDREAKYHRFNP